jgi:prepilin-type processing-associated H-X9-DG protein
MYADNYNGRVPVDSITAATVGGSFNLLSSVVTSPKIYSCPSDAGSHPSQTYPLATMHGSPMHTNISYAYCPYIIWQDQPDSILALDRMNATSANYTKGGKWLGTGGTLNPAPHKDAGGNILFNDGHCTWANTLPNMVTSNNTSPTATSVIRPDF